MQIPLFQSKSEWLPPERIPDLSDAKQIAIDLETRDIGLNEGSGPVVFIVKLFSYSLFYMFHYFISSGF